MRETLLALAATFVNRFTLLAQASRRGRVPEGRMSGPGAAWESVQPRKWEAPSSASLLLPDAFGCSNLRTARPTSSRNRSNSAGLLITHSAPLRNAFSRSRGERDEVM